MHICHYVQTQFKISDQSNAPSKALQRDAEYLLERQRFLAPVQRASELLRNLRMHRRSAKAEIAGEQDSKSYLGVTELLAVCIYLLPVYGNIFCYFKLRGISYRA